MNPGGSGPTLIDGRFELLERLGGGGMGLVWRAVDVVLQREVALKEVRPPDPAALEFDPEGARVLRERVLREARALARLHHPNVVTIYHIVDNAELQHPWLVMELVTGGSLHDRLKQGPMAPADVARVGRGVLAALRAAHQAGIQHRDVKPANVLLRPDGTPVLTDFGIAALRESTSLTHTGSLVGSPEFIAPERLRGEEGNPASDLWSLGIMIFAAAEGYSPLRRTTTMATLAAVLDEPIPAPTRCGPLLPALSAVLVRDPSARCGYDQLDHLLAQAQFSVGPVQGGGVSGAGMWGVGMSGSGMPAGMGMLGAPADQPPTLGNPYGVPNSPTAGASMTGPATTPPWAVADTRPGYGGSWQEPPHDSPQAQRQRRRNAAFAATIGGVAIAGVLGAVIWSMSQSPPSTSHGGTAPSTTPGSGQALPSGGQGGQNADGGQPTTTTPPAAATAASTQDLLTPSGMTTLVASVKSVIGTTKVTDLTVYPDHAQGDVVLKSNSTLYDDFEYSDGKGSDGGPGGTLGDTDTTVDLTQFDWNAIPTLLTTAEHDFKVTGTPTIYIIVSPDLFDNTPEIRVYVTDDYEGGGYITANAKGVVTGKYS